MAKTQSQKNRAGLSDRELEISYWYVSHKLLLKKLLTIALFLFDAVFIGWGTWGFIDHYILKKDYFVSLSSLIAENRVNYLLFHKRNPLIPLEVESVQVVGGSFGNYDLLAKVYNRNSDWYAKRVVYQFQVSGLETDEKETFFLPGEEKYLLDLGIESDQKITNANIIIKDIDWRRLISMGIKDFNTYYSERFNFVIDDVEFIPAKKLGIGSKVPVSRVIFNATNRSAYNYWEVGYVILISRMDKILSTSYILDELVDSGETRELTATFFEKLPVNIDVTIIPEVDILNPDTFREFKHEVGERR